MQVWVCTYLENINLLFLLIAASLVHGIMLRHAITSGLHTYENFQLSGLIPNIEQTSLHLHMIS